MKYELIIFDIDNTLFDSVEYSEYKSSLEPDHRLIHGGIKYKLYARPFLKEFIKFCQKKFKHIAFWTHADGMWLDKFLKNILKVDIPFLFKYDISNATYLKDGSKIKPLSKVFLEFPKFNKNNTIIIEDTPENCVENMENCIIVPEFSIKKHELENKDIVLPLLSNYITKLQSGKIKKNNPIGWFQIELKEFNKKSLKKEIINNSKSKRSLSKKSSKSIISLKDKNKIKSKSKSKSKTKIKTKIKIKSK